MPRAINNLDISYTEKQIVLSRSLQSMNHRVPGVCADSVGEAICHH